ncbi:uncharacterized protein LOC118197193 [Stegodyphus dumicola]|uniref:uncharacterized protein LOC118197193 n=1 Tax=Stegodyphus dumicola TaxID=202533 RepID=UPI0015B2017C|nr:uncharacterized protein LOC118197193 [Stegodyphus dumicola]
MSTNFISCPECQHTFRARKNLYKHVRKFHSSLDLDELKSRKKCRVCTETFNGMNDLEAHMQLLHNSASENKCSHCQFVFKARKNLNEHVRNFHPSDHGEYKDNKQTLVCSICNQKFLHMRDLHSHFKSDHPDITLSFQENIFYSVEDFEIWKAEIERETQSHFSKKCGDQQLVDGRICMRFYCHRSGVFEPKKDRMCRVKNIGSQKIGKTCPAYITAYKKTVLDVTEIQVHYQSVHVGHKCEVARLPLSKNEKVELAGHMNLGVPKSHVLNSLRKNYSPTKRLSLTHRKDLHNICRDYKINEDDVFHQNDAMSVDIRINKMLKEEENSVLIYKPKNSR